MATQTVEFQFVTGLTRGIFRSARLLGSWDGSGRYSDRWTESPMAAGTGEDGCPIFTAVVSLDLVERGKTFHWGVILDGPQGAGFWGIPTEVQDVNSAERYRSFQLPATSTGSIVERYYFTYCRRLGANKHFTTGAASPGLRFAVWAPNAKKVEVVFGDRAKGYIDDLGSGIVGSPVPLTRFDGGIWEGGPAGDFTSFMDRPYMYRIVNEQGVKTYRTDIFSRSQIGKGSVDPADATTGTWMGTPDTLDGTKSCSLIIDPDLVRATFASATPGTAPDLIPADEFWANEFTAGLPVPTRVEDLVVYELHVGSLGFGTAGPGSLGDALDFLDHLVALGVNAVELLPTAEFSGNTSWGYGDTHHFCIESSAGGRDKLRHFVRACHRRGIAVIQDVVYNHFDFNAGRAQWEFDSTTPEHNIYYWYEGRSADYASSHGGYLDNGSSGYTPRFWEEVVRQQFVSSAAFLIEEMHVDGLRVDLTQAIHRDNVRHDNGRPIGSANIFGQKLLREWSRTLRMIRPSVMLIAEDHSEWDKVTKPPADGGLGFNSTWDNAFYHNLIGDSDYAGGQARLLKNAGSGGNEPLDMASFSGALYGSQYNRVVFHESHDEAGNAGGTARTIVTAVNGAALFAETRTFAEARSRVCFGLSLLSAGTPMFFMGEEIGAQQAFKFQGFLGHREDILGERTGNGAKLFRFYQELITLSRRLRSIRSHNIDILHQFNATRVIAFKRWGGDEQVIVVASLNNTPFGSGYVIERDLVAIPNAGWKEIFNSDASVYGGQDVGNSGASLPSNGGRLSLIIPANGLVVLVKE